MYFEGEGWVSGKNIRKWLTKKILYGSSNIFNKDSWLQVQNQLLTNKLQWNQIQQFLLKNSKKKNPLYRQNGDTG